jgi:hypothetical protein
MYDYSTLIVLSSKIPVFVFDLILLDQQFPYAGVSVDPVTHIEGLRAYDLLEKPFPTLIRKKLGT